MSEKKRDRHSLLKEMLALQIKEWGIDAVRKALAALSHELSPSQLQGEPQTYSRAGAAGEGDAARAKATPSSLVARLDVPNEKRSRLLLLASAFERKEFLHTSGDVRIFFEMNGQSPPAVKNRAEAFRHVLRLVNSLPDERLESVVQASKHSGRSELGPLSEAIRSTGDEARRTSVLGQGTLESQSSDEPSQLELSKDAEAPKAFIEARVRGNPNKATKTTYVVEGPSGKLLSQAAFKTQDEAIASARRYGLRPYVATVSDPEKDQPRHWRPA